MTVARGFAIIIASGAVCAIRGGALGYALGRFTPSYYRGVFHGGESLAFDPVQVGIGLGVSQGLIAGLVVGSIVVLAVRSFRDLSVARKASERGNGVSRRLMLIAGGLLALGLCFGSGLAIGLLHVTGVAYHRRYREERKVIAPAIAADPAFARVLGMPLALGSLWALIPAVMLCPLLVARTVLEDRTLHNELPGYEEYAQRVTYRLIPGV
jgi:hypothetical protein